MEWEENAPQCTADMRLMVKIYREAQNFNIVKANHTINKGIKELNKQFSKEETQTGKKYLETCSTPEKAKLKLL